MCVCGVVFLVHCVSWDVDAGMTVAHKRPKPQDEMRNTHTQTGKFRDPYDAKKLSFSDFLSLDTRSLDT